MSKVKKKKVRRNVTVAIAHVRATFNNTVTITDTRGDTLCWASAGTSGFKGSRKSTPFAGQCAGQQAAEKASKYGVKELEVRVKNPGSAKSAITALQTAGMTVKTIETSHPFRTTAAARQMPSRLTCNYYDQNYYDQRQWPVLPPGDDRPLL